MKKDPSELKKGPIPWMAGNSVAANILMLVLLVGGLIYGMQIKQEVFPEFELDFVVISAAYPGASPEEVEEGIVLPIEEAIQGLDGIDEVSSTASEGSGSVSVEAVSGVDLDRLATDIKNEVDRISTFPDDAEEPLVIIPSRKRDVVTIVIYGDQSEHVLQETAEMVRDRLLQDKEITQVELVANRDLEMSIEVSQSTLKAYNLTISGIAQKISNASLDLPSGGIKTSGGEILVRVTERKDYTHEFSTIPIVTGESGTIVTLGEIATIKDGFEDTDNFLIYNNKPAIGIDVYRVGKQTPITVSDAVHKHIKDLKVMLPDGIGIDTMNDKSVIFKQRIELLLKNGYLGLILVFILLGIFLEPRLAFWVTMGIPISFMGSLLFIPHLGTSINMVSLFAFIISLGIVVDDAVVAGENVYSHRQNGETFLNAAILGAREIAVPITFSIITNIVTFMPMYFIPGVMGKIFMHIPVVIASVFVISLVEAIFILPAHLAHQKEGYKSRIMQKISGWQQSFSQMFIRFIKTVYGPSVKMAIRFRYVTFTIGIVLLLITLAYVKSGRMGFTLFPRVESDYAYASAKLPYGSPVEDTRKVLDTLMASVNPIIEDSGGDQQVEGIRARINGNEVNMNVYFTSPEIRPVSTGDFIKQWRKSTGQIPGVEFLKFQSDKGGPGSGSALTVELQHRDTDVLQHASSELANALREYPITSDIDDGFTTGKQQFDIQLKPEAYRLGLTPSDVARQIRSAYYGSETLRQLRGRNEIKVMVRLPEAERQSDYYLNEMLLRTPQNTFVPLRDVVEIKKGRAYTAIERRDGRRKVSVSCDVTPPSQAEMILNDIKTDILPKLTAKYNGLNYSFEGKQADQRESMQALMSGMIIAMMLVYILLAIPFRSYAQPAIIMIGIPFGIVGAIAGHLIMGYSLSILSMFGIVALSGVVVNDSLVLIEFANRRVREGSTPYAAIVNAGIRRFRPILLTTLTTFFGLMPMIFETSRQARFLIPMAISLGFGILFSTLIILMLVPALYIILEDIKAGMSKAFRFLFP